MKCENCGNEVREGAKFCSKCGSNILEQQEDHSGKHNVHETKTEKRCVNCGNVLRGSLRWEYSVVELNIE